MNRQPRAFTFDFAVGNDHPALRGHFPGNPIVPGVLLLGQVLAGVSAELGRTVSTVKHVKFSAALLPDETASVRCEADADEVCFSVQAGRAGLQAVLVRGTLSLAGGGST